MGHLESLPQVGSAEVSAPHPWEPRFQAGPLQLPHMSTPESLGPCVGTRFCCQGVLPAPSPTLPRPVQDAAPQRLSIGLSTPSSI